MKKIIRFLALVLSCAILSGCGNPEIETEQIVVDKMIEETTELNERQQKIMKLEGLSPYYNHLTDRQKEVAIKLEMILCYLEDTYDTEFSYHSCYYDSYSPFVTLRAYDVNDYKRRQIQASINWENGEYVFTDTYRTEVKGANDYEDLFDEFMAENYPKLDYFLDIYVAEIDGEKITNDNSSVQLRIILKECFDTKKEYEDFLMAVAKWMQNDKYHNSIYCQVMDDNDFWDATYVSYSDFRRKGRYEYCFDVDIDSDGDITVDEFDKVGFSKLTDEELDIIDKINDNSDCDFSLLEEMDVDENYSEASYTEISFNDDIESVGEYLESKDAVIRTQITLKQSAKGNLLGVHIGDSYKFARKAIEDAGFYLVADNPYGSDYMRSVFEKGHVEIRLITEKTEDDFSEDDSVFAIGVAVKIKDE